VRNAPRPPPQPGQQPVPHQKASQHPSIDQKKSDQRADYTSQWETPGFSLGCVLTSQPKNKPAAARPDLRLRTAIHAVSRSRSDVTRVHRSWACRRASPVHDFGRRGSSGIVAAPPPGSLMLSSKRLLQAFATSGFRRTTHSNVLVFSGSLKVNGKAGRLSKASVLSKPASWRRAPPPPVISSRLLFRGGQPYAGRQGRYRARPGASFSRPARGPRANAIVNLAGGFRSVPPCSFN